MRPILIAFLLAVPLAGSAADTLFVQSIKAKIVAEPRFGAAVIAEVERGEELTALEEQGRWYRVGLGGQQGWVSRFVLADHPPLDRVTVLQGNEEEQLQGNARRRASTVTTAGAARGLTADERRRADDKGANYYALQRLEKLELTPEEIEAFAAQGLKR